MVNHIRTLLLNRSSSEVYDSGAECWYMDSSFERIQVSGAVSAILRIVMPDDLGMEDRISRVNSLMPFLLDPEFDGYFRMFDTRVTVESDTRPVRTDTIYGFYGRISSKSLNFVEPAVRSIDASVAFGHVGRHEVDSVLDDLYKVFSHGYETSKRFSALMYAIVVKLDFLLNSRSGK